VASGDRVDDLCALKRGNQALSSVITKHNLCHSFDIWHAHLAHVSSKIISMLNKKGLFSCQKAKSHKLLF